MKRILFLNGGGIRGALSLGYLQKIEAILRDHHKIRAELEPLNEREEKSFGTIHKTRYEKILHCEFCIADLTNLNPNAYYELGTRDAVKPYTTIPIIAYTHYFAG